MKEEKLEKFARTVKMYKFNESNTIPDFEIDYAIENLEIDKDLVYKLLDEYEMKIRKTSLDIDDNNKMTDLEILGLTDELTQYKIKDWSDYVYIHEKIDYATSERPYNIIEIFYNIHDRPFPGDGFIYTTNSNCKQQTLKDYLNERVFNKYKDDPNNKVKNIYQI